LALDGDSRNHKNNNDNNTELGDRKIPVIFSSSMAFKEWRNAMT